MKSADIICNTLVALLFCAGERFVNYVWEEMCNKISLAL